MIIVYISCLTGLYKDFSKIEFTINIPSNFQSPASCAVDKYVQFNFKCS